MRNVARSCMGLSLCRTAGDDLPAAGVKCLYKLTPESQLLLKGASDEMCSTPGVSSKEQLLSLRPYWHMVPPVAGNEEHEHRLHELMRAGYGETGGAAAA